MVAAEIDNQVGFRQQSELKFYYHYLHPIWKLSTWCSWSGWCAHAWVEFYTATSRISQNSCEGEWVVQSDRFRMNYSSPRSYMLSSSDVVHQRRSISPSPHHAFQPLYSRHIKHSAWTLSCSKILHLIQYREHKRQTILTSQQPPTQQNSTLLQGYHHIKQS